MPLGRFDEWLRNCYHEVCISNSYFILNMTKRHELKAVVAERGQVTIPKPIRDKLGIGAGAVLKFEMKDRKIVVSRELSEDPISRVVGILKGKTPYTSTDDYINEIRGRVE